MTGRSKRVRSAVAAGLLALLAAPPNSLQAEPEIPVARPVPVETASTSAIQLSPAEALVVGKKIWKNECAGTIEGLTTWNKGEGFASLGIAHFIWYPPGKNYGFVESFPGYVHFAQSQGANVPAWLLAKIEQGCPWTSRAEFEAARNGKQMTELRQFLADTVGLQAIFAARRLEGALPKMKKHSAQPEALTAKFNAVAASPGGVYALIDYVNFKGEGIAPTERYQGQGWGLLQVLECLPDGVQPGDPALAAFSKCAYQVLKRRTENAPPERQARERGWMKGWGNRTKTYRN